MPPPHLNNPYPRVNLVKAVATAAGKPVCNAATQLFMIAWADSRRAVAGTDHARSGSSVCCWAPELLTLDTIKLARRTPCRRSYLEIGMDNPGHSKANPSTPATHADAPSHPARADSYACPICGGDGLIRIRRRFIDRIASMFLGLRRFRCTHSGCHWEGNLRKRTKELK